MPHGITSPEWVNGFIHDDVIKWKHFPCYWPFVRGIHRWPFVRGIHQSPLNSPHKGQWRAALMFPWICIRINGWVNYRKAGDLRRYHAHYDIIVMYSKCHSETQLYHIYNNVSNPHAEHMLQSIQLSIKCSYVPDLQLHPTKWILLCIVNFNSFHSSNILLTQYNLLATDCTLLYQKLANQQSQ